MSSLLLRLSVAVLWLLSGFSITTAQDNTVPYQVFRVRSTDGNTAGQDQVTFVNMLTGETREFEAYGTNYTIAGENLMFLDRLNNQVMMLSPNGTARPHPFIQPTPNTRQLNWVISPDQRYIAWTILEGEPDALITTTWWAALNGEGAQQVLVDGPRSGIQAIPVAFSADDTALYMDYQPETLGNFTPYSEYAGLFEVRLKDDFAIEYLPGEPGCFCGAGFGGGYFVRMGVTNDLSGFDLQVTDLAADVTDRLGTVGLQNYTQGGDVLVSRNGQRAIYALAQVQDFGSPSQSVRTVFVVVDLETIRQETVTSPLFIYLRPVAWTEGNSAVILISPQNNTTWKLTLETGRLEEIARATYIGTILARGTS